MSPPINDTKPVWPQVGYNGRHTGNRYGINVNIPPVQSGNVFWMDTITLNWVNDGSETSIDASGNIYFMYSTSPNGQIIKFRPGGTIIWAKDSLYLDAGCGLALSADETRIYYSTFTEFSCIDSTGSIEWSIPSSQSPVMPAIGKDGTIFTVIDKKLAAVSREGSIKWQLADADFNLTWIALDREDNIVTYKTSSNGLYAVI